MSVSDHPKTEGCNLHEQTRCIPVLAITGCTTINTVLMVTACRGWAVSCALDPPGSYYQVLILVGPNIPTKNTGIYRFCVCDGS